MDERHLITSEYPPAIGGVSDYSHLIATGLAAEGETVHVWCRRSDTEPAGAPGVTVHRELGGLNPADFRHVGLMLEQYVSPRHLLVQWVPHAYGYRAMNLFFCLWLWGRAKLKGDAIEIMVHEPFLPFHGSLRQDAAAAVQRLMTCILLGAAKRIWISIPNWETALRPFLLGRRTDFSWLPVPSGLPVVDDPQGIADVRRRLAAPEAFLIGHFGAYDHYLSKLMFDLAPLLLSSHPNRVLVLLGTGSEQLKAQLISRCRGLRNRVRATGSLSAEEMSRHVSACDLMLQPYQDGVSSRRTSVMAALSHAIPIVTNSGPATERIWHEGEPVKLVQPITGGGLVEAVEHLLTDPVERKRLSVAGRQLYYERFDATHIIRALRGVAA